MKIVSQQNLEDNERRIIFWADIGGIKIRCSYKEDDKVKINAKNYSSTFTVIMEGFGKANYYIRLHVK